MLNHTLKLSLDDNRHLVVGDIHGRYDQLMSLLDIANYDPTKDILYCVGDMIDRGDKSFEVLTFFEEPNRHYIKGNHEAMVLDSDWHGTWHANGGIECMDSMYANGKDLLWLQDMVRDKPWVIDVGEDDEEHAFRIVHAEMPPGWSDKFFKTTLDMAMNQSDTTFSRLIWSRKLIEHAKKNVKEMRPSHHGLEFHPERHRNIFVGHTPHTNIMRCGDHWFLDTWYSRSLSLIDAVTKEKFSFKYE